MEELLDKLRNRQPIRVRASSVADMFDCPSRWVAVHIHKRKCPTSDRAAIGTAVHAGTAYWDSEVLAGNTPSLVAATECAAESLGNDDEEVIWDTEFSKCLDISVSLTAKYCKDEAHKHNFVAVEATCDNLTVDDLGITLTGSTDRIYQGDYGHGVIDIKTGVQAVVDGKAKTQSHAAQIGVYEILAQASSGLQMNMPAKIIGMKTAVRRENQEIATGEIHDAKEVLLGDDNQIGLLSHAALIAHGVIPAYGNPRSILCNKKYCPNFETCFWRR